MSFLKIVPVKGFERIFEVESFRSDFLGMLGKNKGHFEKLDNYLHRCLRRLDEEGMAALQYLQFEHVNGTEPKLYCIRHPHSVMNERYLFVFDEDESALLLVPFLEKSGTNYYAKPTEDAYVILRKVERIK